MENEKQEYIERLEKENTFLKGLLKQKRIHHRIAS
jgi:hypothetical protein